MQSKLILLSLVLISACQTPPASGPQATVTPATPQPSSTSAESVTPLATPSPQQVTPTPSATATVQATPEPTPVPTASPLPATFSNSLNMNFVLQAAGSFQMGSPADQAGRAANEDLHHVTLTKPFLIQTTEVTQRQWQSVMGKNPATHQQPENLERPVENVSWLEVQGFIAALNQQLKGKYRLPSEAEWEYAARAGQSSAFSFGSNARFLGNYAWYNNNSGNPALSQSVGSKQANALGLFDVQGNVAEFVQDFYSDNLGYTALTDPSGPVNTPYKVFKNCAYNTAESSCRLAARSLVRQNFASAGIGFRLVLD